MSWPDDDPPLPERQGYSPGALSTAVLAVLIVALFIGSALLSRGCAQHAHSLIPAPAAR